MRLPDAGPSPVSFGWVFRPCRNTVQWTTTLDRPGEMPPLGAADNRWSTAYGHNPPGPAPPGSPRGTHPPAAAWPGDLMTTLHSRHDAEILDLTRAADPTAAPADAVDVTERLMAEFEHRLGLDQITRIVTGCRRDLVDTPPGPLPELLERLARQRLLDVAAAVPQPREGSS